MHVELHSKSVVGNMIGHPRVSGLLLVVAFTIFALGCGDGPRTAKSGVNGSAAPTARSEYRVVRTSKSRMPHGGAAYVYDVLVPANTSPDQLKTITGALIDQAEVKTPFSILQIFYYDYVQFINWGSETLGEARFGPPPFKEVKAGAYEAMSLDTHFLTKDWTKRPTPAEVRVWAAWIKLTYTASDPVSGQVDYGPVTRAVAERFGMGKQRVRAIVTKCQSWCGPATGALF